MKTNHRRGFVARTEHDSNYYFRKALLKEEGNVARRRTDATALVRFMNGDDGVVFSTSDMGNPWHWD